MGRLKRLPLGVLLDVKVHVASTQAGRKSRQMGHRLSKHVGFLFVWNLHSGLLLEDNLRGLRV